MKRMHRISMVALSTLLGFSAHAKFMRADTETVPVARLVTNLERQIAANSTNAGLHSTLARLHSMAFALKTNQFEATKRDQKPFFGYVNSDHPPTQVRKVDSAPAEAEARNHLKQAIAEYEKALATDPNHLASRLGLGWCLDQAGDKTNALTHYRKALAQAWEKEQNDGTGLNTPITSETVDYMLPLLDPDKDAKEIARIKGYKAAVSKHPRAVTPILIPLEANVPFDDLINPSAAVTFDLDGSGLPSQWGWITPKAAWLVYHPDKRQSIASGLQLFGNVTFWTFWNNGYEALSALDDNGDGELRGEELQPLALWHDANSNGISEPCEIQPLAAWNIIALSCRSQPHSSGIPFQPSGVLLKDGSTLPSYDWIASHSIADKEQPSR
jgi:tetratricopeptide (TPR) repeat protein